MSESGPKSKRKLKGGRDPKQKKLTNQSQGVRNDGVQSPEDAAKKTGEESKESLLPGWVKMLSRSKDIEYYYNKELKVSQWKRPTIEDEIMILKKQEAAEDNKNSRQRMILIGHRRLREREQDKQASAKSKESPEKISKNSSASVSHKRSVNESETAVSAKKIKTSAIPKKGLFKDTFLNPIPDDTLRLSSEDEDVSESGCTGVKLHLKRKNLENPLKTSKHASKKKVFSSDSDSDPDTGQKNRSKSQDTGLPRDRNIVNSSLQKLKDSLEEKKKSVAKTFARVAEKFHLSSRDTLAKKEPIMEDKVETARRVSTLKSEDSTQKVSLSSKTDREISGARRQGNIQDNVLPRTSEATSTTTYVGKRDLNSLAASPGQEYQTNASNPFEKNQEEEEEDMEAEEYPKEYLRLLTDISGVREDLKKGDCDMTGPLTESFMEARSTRPISPTVKDTAQHVPLYIVIDTNVLLNALNFVSSIKMVQLHGHDLPCVVIPWVVMTELDFIKDNKKKLVTEATQHKAWMAVKYLHNHLEIQHPQLIGQKPSEASLKFEELADITSNDDKVLQCCIQWQKKYSSSVVVLLTGDIHLRSKCMILGIPVYSEKSLQNWFKQKTKTNTSIRDTVPPLLCRSENHPQSSSTMTPMTSPNNPANIHGQSIVDPSMEATSSGNNRLRQQSMSNSRNAQSNNTPVHSGTQRSFAEGCSDPDSDRGFTLKSPEPPNFYRNEQRSSGDFMASIHRTASKNPLTSPEEQRAFACQTTVVPASNISMSGAEQFQTGAGTIAQGNEQAFGQKSNNFDTQEHSEDCSGISVSFTDPQNQGPSLVQNNNMQGQIMLDLRRCMSESLGIILELNMKRIYDHLWMTIVYKKPPWSLEDILLCYKKHWIAVFGEIFGRENLSYIDQLIATLKCSQGEISWIYLQELIGQSLGLCEVFLKYVGHYSLVRTTKRLQKLKLVVQAVTTRGLTCTEIEALMSEIDREFPTGISNIKNIVDLVQEAFQLVWEMILNISTDIAPRLQTKPLNDASRTQDIKEFSTFCQQVASIHRAYSIIIVMDPEAGIASDNYLAICQALDSFALHYGMPGWRGVTPDLMKRFDEKCRRLVLENGFAQLKSLMNGISQCNSYLGPEENIHVQNSINQVTEVT